MNLELKHLVPYVDKELYVKIIDFNRNYKQGKIYKMSLQLLHDKFKNNSNKNIFLPILRPLSDLTKEIEINGTIIFPLMKIQKNNDHAEDFQINISDIISKLSYTDCQILFEWHFDVFGLIPEGLAIDKNTLE